ncbi:methyl-accepting chemotaxis (MCP) signaling domain protein [Burkholderia pseudomallei MSHR4377]|uniref:methyl-accepting chemotaxis protein n=1 Tax=Burkholderia pseudomallei TaxID=28450 RepID=UPI0000F28B5E|nr:methyl-accepting chemotaxis protein [Burkholderia pseudomallei]ABN81968.1 methyl-accepting chemotaxis protein I [Burkholderia pseudomallei 668]AIS88277.1 methyl-accepting chemotaxis (MCP) signaling domain protein [Burkholderia pseudomallei NAU35A-3]AJX87951.1 methyl-accepting chemotaxis (MCP) signaling domain protein [Burkholderia pseudomallei]KGS56070.1 methyl-accepting chemotaxis (MCP) signaling domain protein [Burkholderia pseudomallei MSHR5609]KGS70752.1 methyl-accepting chemotaxis (MCP
MSKHVFGPGMRLMARMKLPRKLVILAALFIVPLVAALYATLAVAWHAYATTQGERDGISILETTQDLLKAVQVRRGAGASVLAGNEAMRAKFDAASASAGRLAATLKQQVRGTDRFDIVAAVDALASEYGKVAAGGLGTSAAALFGSHTDVIHAIFLFEKDLAVASRLGVDPDASNYHLIDSVLFVLPGTAETVGVLRGKGAAALVGGALGEADKRELAVRAGSLAEQMSVIRHHLDRMKDRLGAGVPDGVDLGAVAAFQRTAAALAGGDASIDAKTYFQRGTDAIDALYRVHGTLAQQLRERLAARAHAEQVKVAAILALSVVLVACALYLFVAFAMSTHEDVAQLSDCMRAVGDGDLRARLAVRGGDEFAFIKRGFNALLDVWAQTLTETRRVADSVMVGSQQIAAGNLDLSGRTETQAASLEQTAASMEELTSTVRHNASNASHASTLSAEASERAADTGRIVTHAVSLMTRIHDSSNRMAEIVTVIEGIAFQTNILALNAAVEAARAGEQGKGFAVVAGEVRALAHRSATAAKDVKELIHESIRHVTDGSSLFQRADDAIRSVNASIKSVDTVVSEIAKASEQQSDGIEQVNAAITQMDEVTQRNAALVEESAAASASLREQAEHMGKLVGRFVLA